MKYKFFVFIGIPAAAMLIIFSCSKQQQTMQPVDYSFTEEFDTVSNAIAKGWMITNNTKPLGTISWMQGFYYVSTFRKFGLITPPVNYPSSDGFGANNPSFSGQDFIMTTSECGHYTANCSNWLISPAVTMKNGDKISFYTRTYASPAVAADRLEVRVNTYDSSGNVGRDTNSVGGFTNVILDINPSYVLEGIGAYPGTWTKYTATVSGLSGMSTRKSRIAFRYYVPDGGPLGNNGLGVGIDKFQFISF
jgi:hypothetical protein